MNANVTVPTILKSGEGELDKIGCTLKDNGFKNVAFYYGSGLIDMFGERVFASLSQNEVSWCEYCEVDSVEIDTLVNLAFALPKGINAIVGMGGGKVIDAAKYMSFLLGIPFVCIPTSIATDGFCSATASLLVQGRRVSVPAVIAHTIIVDLGVIKTCPDKFIYSGIGDMMSKITALKDWQFEAQHGVGYFNDFAAMISRKALNSFVRTPFESIHDDLFIKELVDSLTLSGLSNVVAGSSKPVSGSEHLISHALDSFLEMPQQHGIQVGIATYIMACVQNHRYKRVDDMFRKSGFWSYVETLGLKREDYEKAIDMAPSVKSERYTYLSEEKNREAAKKLLVTDENLKKVFG